MWGDIKEKIKSLASDLISAQKIMCGDAIDREARSEAEKAFQRAQNGIRETFKEYFGKKCRHLMPRYYTVSAEEVVKILETKFQVMQLEKEGKLDGIVFEDSKEEVVKINAPEFYLRDDFLNWLNDPSTATWHAPGTPAGDMSDAFLYITTGEGSCSEEIGATGIPEDIFNILDHMLTEQYGPHVEILVWLKNLNYPH